MILKKIRLDQILFDRKLAESKTKAQSMIMAGQVSVEGKIINKSGFNISPYSLIEIKNLGPKWVSRGAYKLIKALDENNINVENQVCLDLGASTGGFTDVLIQRGAKKVFSVDVLSSLMIRCLQLLRLHHLRRPDHLRQQIILKVSLL